MQKQIAFSMPAIADLRYRAAVVLMTAMLAACIRINSVGKYFGTGKNRLCRYFFNNHFLIL